MQYEACVERAKAVISSLDDARWELGDLSVQACRFLGKQEAKGTGTKNTSRDIDRWIADIGWGGSRSTLMQIRSTAAAWPKKHRVQGVSYSVFRTLRHHKDRFKIVRRPGGITVRDTYLLLGRRELNGGRILTIAEGIKRLQSAESWLRSAARVDYSQATDDQLEIVGECTAKVEMALNEFLESADMLLS